MSLAQVADPHNSAGLICYSAKLNDTTMEEYCFPMAVFDFLFFFFFFFCHYERKVLLSSLPSLLILLKLKIDKILI
jgi:hypothetical protein